MRVAHISPTPAYSPWRRLALAALLCDKAGMIICSCTRITSKDIAEAVSALRTADPLVVLTPGLIYRYLGKRPSCGCCLPLVTKLMVAYDEEGPDTMPLSQPVPRGSSRGRKDRP
jgi:bacterioferritin-associated ferredoxin